MLNNASADQAIARFKAGAGIMAKSAVTRRIDVRQIIILNVSQCSKRSGSRPSPDNLRGGSFDVKSTDMARTRGLTAMVSTLGTDEEPLRKPDSRLANAPSRG
jgi:hypothetical protein